MTPAAASANGTTSLGLCCAQDLLAQRPDATNIVVEKWKLLEGTVEGADFWRCVELSVLLGGWRPLGSGRVLVFFGACTGKCEDPKRHTGRDRNSVCVCVCVCVYLELSATPRAPHLHDGLDGNAQDCTEFVPGARATLCHVEVVLAAIAGHLLPLVRQLADDSEVTASEQIYSGMAGMNCLRVLVRQMLVAKFGDLAGFLIQVSICEEAVLACGLNHLKQHIAKFIGAWALPVSLSGSAACCNGWGFESY
eukprot:253025-Amphidinium_carterae.1